MKMSLLDRLRGPLLVEAQDPAVPAAPAAPAPIPAAPEPAALGTPGVPAPGEEAAPLVPGTVPDATPAEEAPAAGEEEKPEEEEEEEEEESPIVNWPEHLQDIANDIQGTLQVKVEIAADKSKTIPIGNDPDLGYHIVGLVHFPDGMPSDIKMKLQGRPLKYSAYVSPDGELGTSVDLFFSTTDPYEAGEEPTYHVNSNQYQIVS